MNPLRPYILPAVALLSLGSACALLSAPAHDVPLTPPAPLSAETPHHREEAALQARWRTVALRRARAQAEADLAVSFNAPATFAPENGAEQVAHELAAFTVRRLALEQRVVSLQRERQQAETKAMKATDAAALESAWQRVNTLDTRIAELRDAYRRQGRDEAELASQHLAQIESQLHTMQLASGQLDDACLTEWQGGRTRVC